MFCSSYFIFFLFPFMCFFFFKQNTAYELPISAWSSDVCSSDVVGRRLAASTDLHRAVLDSDLSIIAVGTPFDGASIDLGYVRAAATQIGTALREKDGYHVVVVKSTVVPGTTEDVVLPALEAASGKRSEKRRGGKKGGSTG